MTEAKLIDCMEYMKTVPDKYFDLAIVDPPYGGGGKEQDGNALVGGGTTDYEQEMRASKGGRFGGHFDRYFDDNTGGVFRRYEPTAQSELGQTATNPPTIFDGAVITNWDYAPPKEYFDELARVSKNQIIWGGNYFGLPPTRCFIVWEKLSISEDFSMAMCEYAWTSFNENAKLFKCAPQGNKKSPRIHPCEKPIALYEWLLNNYAKKGDKILDTHLGSGTSRIAAHRMGFDFVGCEINEFYFRKQEERFAKETAQVSIFDIMGE